MPCSFAHAVEICVLKAKPPPLVFRPSSPLGTNMEGQSSRLSRNLVASCFTFNCTTACSLKVVHRQTAVRKRSGQDYACALVPCQDMLELCSRRLATSNSMPLTPNNWHWMRVVYWVCWPGFFCFAHDYISRTSRIVSNSCLKQRPTWSAVTWSRSSA